MHSTPKENKLNYVTHSTNQTSLSNLSDKYNYKPKLLNLLSLNIQSLTAKKVSFGNLISERNLDIIALSETWLKPEILSSEFFPAGYKIFRKDRHDGYGGVLLACHDSLNCQQLSINSVLSIDPLVKN